MAFNTFAPYPGLDLTPLAFVSPGDFRFDKWKAATSAIAPYFRFDSRIHERLDSCADILGFSLDFGSFRLHSARFCCFRFCPLCAWRRRLVWVSRLVSCFSGLLASGFRFLFLTLGCRNCHVSDLRSTVSRLSLAFRRLSGSAGGRFSVFSRLWPAVGYFRSLEITRNFADDSLHPHLHCVLVVPPSYFSAGGGYLVQNSELQSSDFPGWVQLWQSALDVDYLPTAHVRSVRGDSFLVLKRHLTEVCKYILKPDSVVSPYRTFSQNSDFLAAFSRELFGLRSVSAGGLVRSHLSISDPDCEEMLQISVDPLTSSSISDTMYFKWFSGSGSGSGSRSSFYSRFDLDSSLFF